MKKLALIGLLGLALAACTSETPTPSPEPSTTVSAPSTTAEFRADEDAYFGSLDSQGIHYVSKTEVLSIGHRACEAMTNGLDIEQVVSVFNSQYPNYKSGDGEKIVFTAVNYLCPENKKAVSRYQSRELGMGV